MKNLISELHGHKPALHDVRSQRVSAAFSALTLVTLAVLAPLAAAPQSATANPQPETQRTDLPPRVLQAERFLRQRGWTPGNPLPARALAASAARVNTQVKTNANPNAAATWQQLGPMAVQTPNFGLVTGRIAAIALDPSDTTGNTLYLGTTGGGVWKAQNAATSNPASIVFTPLTDTLAALGGVPDASISIGALSVQPPGGAGVILAGTGDPNDVLDSYYGAGILRSVDGGNSWTLITQTRDSEDGIGTPDFSFVGEGFAGFAWNADKPQWVVAAVSQAYEGTLVNAGRPGLSYQGLYYSNDSGVSWHLATITDGPGLVVQGINQLTAQPDGNAVTSVVWNPKRHEFVAAVRFHGYYQSPDGVTWTRMASQPATGLTAKACPNNLGSTGSIACPIFRGVLAVNPTTGDTFAWTVDINDQDQGLWHDQCNLAGNACRNDSITFSRRWSTAALETNTPNGSATIALGSYNLALAAAPAGPGAGQDTVLFAGANDLWKCSLAMGCAWRNTTNSTSCRSAQVGEFQHALEWNISNPLEIFVGNDSGLWRSMDAVGETGAVCSASDSTHFQNLNGGLGSLAEVISVTPVTSSPYKMMAGLGVNGTAGIKSSSAVADWPQILTGFGGPVVAAPPPGTALYVNNQSGVSIYKCAQTASCIPADFGTSPIVTNVDVSGDGATMPTPAPFLIDAIDSSQLLVGTCRVWRGSADGSSWSSSNAISNILDTGLSSGACAGDALIRSMAVTLLPSGLEQIYVGMYGSASGGANLPGHVLTATFDPASSTMPVWHDLTLSPVVNDASSFNKFGMDVSSIVIDSHDATGKTVYVTIGAGSIVSVPVHQVYSTTDAGAHWTNITANFPGPPVSGIAVDPQNADTLYLATDVGVWFTTQASACKAGLFYCWSVFGTGLPSSPVVAVNASALGADSPILVAATYGRGIWQSPLFTAGTTLTSVATNPTALAFAGQMFGTTSGAQTLTLTNTGSNALTVSAPAITSEFAQTNNCENVSVAPGDSCTFQVTFTPAATGDRVGQLTISANVYGGQIVVDLTGTGTPAGVVTLTPTTIDFGQIQVGSTSALFPVQATNSGTAAVPIISVTITPQFVIATNSCGTTSLPTTPSCQLQLKFAPTQAGPAAGTLTFTDGAGVQTVQLNGTGAAAATDTLDQLSLSFPGTAVGTLSTSQIINLTNSGDLPLKAINVTPTGPFQTTDTCGGQLPGKSVCTISAVFAPTQAGSQTGSLVVSDAMRTQTVTLSGSGIAAAAIRVNPSSLTFSNQQPGVASAPQTVTINNTGGVPMADVGFQITGAAASSYSLAATTCGGPLPGGGSCTVQVVFTPAATGAISATLTVSSSTLGVTPASVSLNGSGQLTGGLGGNPAQLTFTAVGVGQASAALPITITNNSSYAVSTLTLAATGPFTLSQNTCTTGLAAGASCTTSVIFQPTTAGAATGALSVSSSTLASPASIALYGMGFDFSAAVSGSSTLTVASGQTANYTVNITPAQGVSGVFTYTCGALPTNTQCQFSSPTTTISANATGSLTVSILTGKSGNARLQSPTAWQALPMLCSLLLLPLALRRRKALLLPLILLAALVSAISSCTSSGGGTIKGTGGSGSSTATPPGTYTVTVTFSSTGISHPVALTMAVD